MGGPPPPYFLQRYDSKGVRQGRFARGLEAIDSKGVRRGRFLERFCSVVDSKGLTQGRDGAPADALRGGPPPDNVGINSGEPY
jgi:hypothetical protein